MKERTISCAIPDEEMALLAAFVERVQEEIDLIRQSSPAETDQELSASALVAALLIIAANILSDESTSENRDGVRQSFLLGAAEAFAAVFSRHRAHSSTLLH